MTTDIENHYHYNALDTPPEEGKIKIQGGIRYNRKIFLTTITTPRGKKRKMATPYWITSIIKWLYPLRDHFARITRWPLVAPILDRLFFDGDHMVYLPKDRVIIQQSVNAGENIVLPSSVLHHFIDHTQALFIMDKCLCRVSADCQNHPHDLGCIFLGSAALKINPRLGRPVSREEAHAHVRRCQEAGLVHMIGRDRLDPLWMGVFPARQLLTICNCCKCCCLFNILPHIEPSLSARISRMPGVKVEVDAETCSGCGRCLQDVCFANAISLENGSAYINTECRGCGRCVEICPQQAIALTIEDDDFIENTIARIEPLVDLN